MSVANPTSRIAELEEQLRLANVTIEGLEDDLARDDELVEVIADFRRGTRTIDEVYEGGRAMRLFTDELVIPYPAGAMWKFGTVTVRFHPFEPWALFDRREWPPNWREVDAIKRPILRSVQVGPFYLTRLVAR